jgi:hypothetical protein
MERVKPERDREQPGYLSATTGGHFGNEPPQTMRTALGGLARYIATVETAKHRTFQFLDASVLPDNKLIAIASG